jgi:hypothetical protein
VAQKKIKKRKKLEMTNRSHRLNITQKYLKMSLGSTTSAKPPAITKKLLGTTSIK